VILPVFSKRYPNIRIEAHEGSAQEVIAMLDHDKVDFTIFQFPSSYDNVIFEHLAYERILFAVNETNPLLRSVDLKTDKEVNIMSKTDFLRFKNEPFVFIHIQASQNSRALAQMYLNKLHIKPNIVLETRNMSTVINMVKAGMGVGFIPETVLKTKEQTTGVLFFQVDEPPLRRELGIAYKAANKLSRQDELFISAIRELIHD
jgi:DNA-binding transcriptional LysR family regulator